ncbi:hypothetical protein [Brevibacterium sp. FAM 24630]|uniref:hypothetical protein n=1 Tax=unclassified Brevibacterium TaxID=2614124 RepID=UPI003C7A0EC5
MTEPRTSAGKTAEAQASAGPSTGAGAQENGERVISTQLTESVTGIGGVTGLAPGLRDMVATAAARVMRRPAGGPPRVDVARSDDGWSVRVDAHLDDSRSVSEIVDELFAVIAVDLRALIDGPVGDIDIDVRVVSRGR